MKAGTTSAAQRAGLIAAAILGVLFALTVVLSLSRSDLVVPTNGVTASNIRDNPGGLDELPKLQARTRLQEWPENARPPAEADAGRSGATAMALGPPSNSGEELTHQWLGDRQSKRDLLQPPQFRQGLATLPATESGVLVQPQGRTWRSVRNEQVLYGGGLYILGISLLIAAFLAWRGRIPLKEGESGLTVPRFNAFERANHWLTSASFLLMALTGVVILYGDHLIRPWLGASTYAWLARASAWSHVAFAVPFIIGVIVMIFLWMRENVPERLDWEWLKRGGGFMSDEEPSPPARKFNAGQKLVFWSVIAGAAVLTITGLFLMFPFYFAGYTGMQVAQVVHAVVALLLIGVIIGHIYIGTVGMVGAFDAMWSGRVDSNWAKEHHSLWYPQVAGRAIDRAKGALAQREVGLRRSAQVSFASGLAAAIVLALVMLGIYSVSGTPSSATDNPAVHLTAVDHGQLSSSGETKGH